MSAQARYDVSKRGEVVVKVSLVEPTASRARSVTIDNALC